MYIQIRVEIHDIGDKGICFVGKGEDILFSEKELESLVTKIKSIVTVNQKAVEILFPQISIIRHIPGLPPIFIRTLSNEEQKRFWELYRKP